MREEPLCTLGTGIVLSAYCTPSFLIEWILIYLDCKELNLEAVWGICRTFVRTEFVGKMCIYEERKGVERGEKQKSSSSWDSRFPGWRFRMMDSLKKRGKVLLLVKPNSKLTTVKSKKSRKIHFLKRRMYHFKENVQCIL